jgi:hypothetical protein
MVIATRERAMISLQTPSQSAANLRFSRACDALARAEADYRSNKTAAAKATRDTAQRALAAAHADRGIAGGKTGG